VTSSCETGGVALENDMVCFENDAMNEVDVLRMFFSTRFATLTLYQ
jgi:hypothetical protein